MQSRRSHLALVVAGVLVGTLLACDSPAATSPNLTPRLTTPQRRADVILGDTLTCRSGWQIIDGRYVCN